MQNLLKNLLFLFIILLTGSCQLQDPAKKVVVMQPFDDMPQKHVQEIYRRINPVYDTVIIRKAIPLPALAYTAPRNRYRADSLIRFLKNRVGKDTLIMGLTSKDISTTKGKFNDYGIMGLAYSPGNSCVISSFRLNKNKLADQLYKVAIHELGHTTGLPHCKIKSCYLRDAEGGNPLDHEISFCKTCQSHLKNKGWKLGP